MQLKKAFTLLELVVAMAIIATLLGLSLYGVQAVQRSQRDTERRASLQNINLELASYYAANSQYPSSITVTQTAINFGGRSVPLKGAATACTPNDFVNANVPISTSTCSVYCFYGEGSSYYLGVNLEGNGWGEEKTAQQLGNAGACGSSSPTYITNAAPD